MTTLVLSIILIACIVAISLTINGYSAINSKSRLSRTNDSYLESRQGLMDALDSPRINFKEKPKSNLRGVKNKRFRKK